MKKEKLYEILGDINEEYVAEAHKTQKKQSVAWVKWGATAACLCLVAVAAFAASKIIPILAPREETPKYGNTVSYVGYASDKAIYESALNSELFSSSGGSDLHLPIFKLDTLEDLEQFKSEFGSVIFIDQSYNDERSFEDTLEKTCWDTAAFYEDNSLLIIYVPANSGSFRFGVKDVITSEDSICIQVEQKNDPDVHTEDMSGWLILVEISDEEANSYTNFDAVFVSEKAEDNKLFAKGNIVKIDVSSLPEGRNYSFCGEDVNAITDYLSSLSLISEFEENPDKYDGMTWIITLEYENGDTLDIYHFGNMFIRSQSGSWYKMTYEEASRFDALLYELSE